MTMDNSDNIVRKFTGKECFAILKNLIVHKKADKDTYTVILLWLTGILNKRQFAHLRTIAGGNIIAKDINANTDELIELVHEVIYELIREKTDPDGTKKGLRYKVEWEKIPITNKVTGKVEHVSIEGNEGRIVSYIYSAFRFIISKALGRNYRGSVNYSNFSNLAKAPEIQALRERMEKETDSGITTPDLIAQLQLEGFDDKTIHRYRYIYSLGDLRTFTELTEEIEIKGAVRKELEALSSAESYKKALYEQIITVLNSDELPKINREFLKGYFGIPSVVEIYGTKKVFESDLVLFFELYPEYKKILKVKRINFSGKRRNVRWVNDESIVTHSNIYKESIAMFKKKLAPRLDYIHQKYQDDLDAAQDLIHAYNQPLDLGSDLHFAEMTNVNLEEICGKEI